MIDWVFIPVCLLLFHWKVMEGAGDIDDTDREHYFRLAILGYKT
jgi:hypothetical protein